jgi:hypothetical protein
MLKSGDPLVQELVANLRKAFSGRYAEESIWSSNDTAVLTESDSGVTFERLKMSAQMDVLNSSVPWDHYKDQGLSDPQAGVIFANVREGKPLERWLEGIFDEAVLENHNVASFKARVEDSRNSNYYFEEMDGDHKLWADLSAASKLQYIASDAARYDVPFERFAEAVKDTVGDVGDAALQVILHGQKELHAIAKLLPDDDRAEGMPLAEQVKDILDYASALEARETHRQQGTEKLFEGIRNVLDGKPPQGWAECAKAFQDILRGNLQTQQEAASKERGRDM